MTNELYHHGIKGQKWGIRRFQNYDGTWKVSRGEDGKRKPFQATAKFIKNARQKAKDAEVKRLRKAYPDEKVNEYRQLIAKKNPKKAKELESKTDDEIRAEMQRRKEMMADIAALAVYGIAIGGACYIEYKTGIAQKVIESAKDVNNQFDPNLVNSDLIKQAAKETYDDVDFCLNAGEELQRVVGFKDFSLDKAQKYLYVTNNPLDNLVYQACLGFRDSEPGVRENVLLEAKNSIKAPAINKMYDTIRKELFTNDEYIDKLADTMAEFSDPRHYKAGGKKREEAIKYQKDLFNSMTDDDQVYHAIWAVVRGRGDADMLVDVFKKQGYNALLDTHDIHDKLARTPLILLDAKNDAIVKGQQAVNQIGAYKEALREIKAYDPKHPAYGPFINDFMAALMP